VQLLLVILGRGRADENQRSDTEVIACNGDQVPKIFISSTHRRPWNILHTRALERERDFSGAC
jgi:hypothetical protein